MQKSQLHIAGIQFDISWEDKARNFKRIEEEFLPKVPRQTDLLVLPEMFSTGFSMNVQNLAEDMQGTSLEWMLDVAKKNDFVVCGSIPIAVNGKFRNRFLWVEPTGEVQYYDKRHLFSYGKEDKYYDAGTDRKIVEIKGWKVCLQICYDLRFPVWSRNNEDFDMLLYIASWPSKRIKAWSQLLAARAIENLAYVCAVNRVGEDGNKLSYTGQSTIINHEGTILNSLGEYEGVIIATLSKRELSDFRNKFQFLNDRDEFQLK